jgi:3-oxoacyl-[acyl-carrier-protein] synthase II
MEFKRVVVTGLGALTPIGNNVPDYWDSLIKGVSGISSRVLIFRSSKQNLPAKLKTLMPTVI